MYFDVKIFKSQKNQMHNLKDLWLKVYFRALREKTETHKNDVHQIYKIIFE